MADRLTTVEQKVAQIIEEAILTHQYGINKKQDYRCILSKVIMLNGLEDQDMKERFLDKL